MIWEKLSEEIRPDGLIYISNFDPPTVVGDPPLHSNPPAPWITTLNDHDTAFHFYVDRVSYPELAGILVSFSAKLVSKTGIDTSVYEGTLLAQVGCDFKTSDGSVIRDAFVGSQIPITKDLRRFYGTTMTYGQLAANYPPIDLYQLTQIDPVGIDPDYIP